MTEKYLILFLSGTRTKPVLTFNKELQLSPVKSHIGGQ